MTQPFKKQPYNSIPLNHSLRNGWTAVSVQYRDGRESGVVCVENAAEKARHYVPLKFAFGGTSAHFADVKSEPALQAPPGAVDFLEAVISTAVTGDKLDRISAEKAHEVVTRGLLLRQLTR